MKKSQMEIMGLAVIVILLSLALVFVIRFVAFEKPSEVSKEFRHSELGANFLNTFIETNDPECMNIKFSTLLGDCADDEAIYCQGDTSCSHLEAKTGSILEDTFGRWNVDYYFIASRDIENPIDTGLFPPIGRECSEGKVKIQPLPTRKGTIYLSLYICD